MHFDEVFKKIYDYVTKPFIPLELLARVKAQLRRYKKYDAKKTEDEIFFRNGLTINKSEHTEKYSSKSEGLLASLFKVPK